MTLSQKKKKKKRKRKRKKDREKKANKTPLGKPLSGYGSLGRKVEKGEESLFKEWLKTA